MKETKTVLTQGRHARQQTLLSWYLKGDFLISSLHCDIRVAFTVTGGGDAQNVAGRCLATAVQKLKPLRVTRRNTSVRFSLYVDGRKPLKTTRICCTHTQHTLHRSVSVLSQDALVGIKSLDELLGGQHGERVLQQQNINNNACLFVFLLSFSFF